MPNTHNHGLRFGLDGKLFAYPWTEREGRLLTAAQSLMLALELMLQEADDPFSQFCHRSTNSSCRHSQGKGGG